MKIYTTHAKLIFSISTLMQFQSTVAGDLASFVQEAASSSSQFTEIIETFNNLQAGIQYGTYAAAIVAGTVVAGKAVQEGCKYIADRRDPLATIEYYRFRDNRRFVRACSFLRTTDEIMQALTLTRNYDDKQNEIWRQHAPRLSTDDRMRFIFSGRVKFEHFLYDWRHTYYGQPTKALEWLVAHTPRNKAYTFRLYIPYLLQTGADAFKASTPHSKNACRMLLEQNTYDFFIDAAPEGTHKETIFAIFRTMLNEYIPDQSSNLVFDRLTNLISLSRICYGFQQEDILALLKLIGQNQYKEDPAIRILSLAVENEIQKLNAPATNTPAITDVTDDY